MPIVQAGCVEETNHRPFTHQSTESIGITAINSDAARMRVLQIAAILSHVVSSWTVARPRHFALQPTASHWARTAPLVCRAKKEEHWARRLSDDSPLREGSVVAATPGSFDHYFLESLVLLIDHSDKGTVGVLLNHETPWTVADMTDSMGEVLSGNTLFLGGDAGRDTMLMMHNMPLLDGARPIGETPLCLGGVREAISLVEAGQLRASRLKFFYKTVEWLPGALQQQREDGMFEHIALSPSLLLQQSGQRSMWAEVRQLMSDAEKAVFEAVGGAGDPLEIKDLPATRYAPSAARADLLAQETRAPSVTASTAAAPVGTSTIAKVVGYRQWKGLEQWQVQWPGLGPEEGTWELMGVVEAEGLREAAEQRRREHS